MNKILVVGTGGLAREFASYFSDCSEQFSIIGFSSKNRNEHLEFCLPGVFFEGDVTPIVADTDQAVIAIGHPAVKKKISEKLKAMGFTFPSFIHPTSVVSSGATIEEGVVISPHCVISPNVYIHKFSYVNFSCGIGHDAIVGSCVQINPGSQIGGGAHIGDGCLLGSGSTILQGVPIGANATVASGAVVFSRVSESTTVMGNPARRMAVLET